MDIYEVMLKRDTSGECFKEHVYTTTIKDVSNSHLTITGMEEGSRYIITVVEINAAGRADSDSVTATTMETGEILNGS